MHTSRQYLIALTLPAIAFTSSVARAQSASIVYRLGKDTLAIEQYTRSATAMTGEMVQRSGPSVARVRYQIAIGKDGRPTTVTMTRTQADGTPIAGAAREYRFSLGADSAVREVVFADSTQRRAFAAKRATVNFPTFVYGPTELLAMLRKGGASDSIPALGLAGGMGFSGLQPLGGDSLRLRGAGYAMVLRFDPNNRLQFVDGRGTTNKVIAERGAGGLDLAAMAKGMKPTGVLSLREDARAGFGAGAIVVVDYGRPMVRERSVWGGVLVPFDSVWRAGANDATHLFTTRPLTFGTVSLTPGMYTLWVQHTRQGTFLIVNRQTGQWGTQYDATQDVGRVELQSAAAPGFVEELTYTVRALGPNRGVLELAWGDRVMSAPFSVGAAR